MDVEEAFWAPRSDGVSFVNTDTGEVHVCFDRCDQSVDYGDRVVCPLSKMVLGMTDAAQPPPRKKMRDRIDVADVRVERDRESRRRIGYDLINEIFMDSGVSAERRDMYVERAMRMYDWLNEKIPFDAMLYATLVCASEGVDTPTVSFDRDDEVARHVRPLRYVGKLGIKQNAVTKAYTAIMKKKGGGHKMMF